MVARGSKKRAKPIVRVSDGARRGRRARRRLAAEVGGAGTFQVFPVD